MSTTDKGKRKAKRARKKTGKKIRKAVKSGALMEGLGGTLISVLERYGKTGLGGPGVRSSIPLDVSPKPKMKK